MIHFTFSIKKKHTKNREIDYFLFLLFGFVPFGSIDYFRLPFFPTFFSLAAFTEYQVLLLCASVARCACACPIVFTWFACFLYILLYRYCMCMCAVFFSHFISFWATKSCYRQIQMVFAEGLHVNL